MYNVAQRIPTDSQGFTRVHKMMKLLLIRHVMCTVLIVLVILISIDRISAQKESARVQDLPSLLDVNYNINTTNLYNVLAARRNNVTANVYGADINKVSQSLKCCLSILHPSLTSLLSSDIF